MKIFKYVIKDISAGIHIHDVAYLLYTNMVEEFTETILKLKVHTVDDEDSFYFISDMDDQNKMIKIFNDFDTEENKEIFGIFELSYGDATDEILNNIDKYDSIENFNDKNTLLNYYYSVYTPDAILEKVYDRGILSLSKHDKIILDESVRYK